MKFKKGLLYMMMGAAVGTGAHYAYHHYANGDLMKTFHQMKDKTQNELEDMM